MSKSNYKKKKKANVFMSRRDAARRNHKIKIANMSFETVVELVGVGTDITKRNNGVNSGNYFSICLKLFHQETKDHKVLNCKSTCPFHG
jgi:hypothetical protein